MDFGQFEKRFRPGEILPIYLIVAGEPFFARSALRMIREARLKEADPATCLSEYNGKETRCRTVLEDCRTRPMFGPGKLVIVEQADAFVRENLERLAAYTANPASSASLVLVAEKVDRRWGFVQALSKQGGLIECKRLYDNRIPSWLIQRARGWKKRLDPAAAAAFIDHVGTDLELLDRQIQNLVLFVGDADRIRTEDVDALVGTDHKRAGWQLSDAVAKRQVRKALTVLNRLLREGVESTQVIALLARNTEQMLRMKPLLRQGTAGPEIATELGLHPYRAKKMAEDARHMKIAELKQQTRLLLDADVRSKSESGDTDLLLEMLVVRLCAVGQS